MQAQAIQLHRGGSGEPLVLIHGIGSCWQIWEPVIAGLEQQHEVLAIDLPGYGASPPPEGEPTVPALVDAVESALDDFGLERPHLAGNSMGGWIAAELAARGRAATVTAISPAGLWLRREFLYSYALLRGTLALATRIAPRADMATRSRVGRQLIFGHTCAHGARIEPANAARQVRAYAHSPSFVPTLDWIRRQHAMPRGLERIACPVTVAWGSRDLLLPPRQAQRWVRLIDGARMVWLPGLGHAPMADDPGLVTRTILEGIGRARQWPARRAAAPA
ncbi:MAG: alpha/beta fold hydrolase [Thermoleophilaceae bacterium]